MVAYIAYGAAMLSLIVLRYKKPYKDIERPFKVEWNKNTNTNIDTDTNIDTKTVQGRVDREYVAQSSISKSF